MKYESISKLSDADFKRRTGIQKRTFVKMHELVYEAEQKRKKISGRPQKLSYPDQILMTLEYLREYRTYFHVAVDYGISESNCYKIIKKIESILISSEEFSLPKRTQILSDNKIEVVLIDVTETPVERPKKSKSNTIQARRRDTQ